MPFTDRDGVSWLAYIEGVPSAARWQRSRASLPGRRLRFDSTTDSRATIRLPAGSPFLADERLQSLLDEAASLPPVTWATRSPASGASMLDHPAIEWAARVGEFGRELAANWSSRWRRRADRRNALRHRRFLGMLTGLSEVRAAVALAMADLVQVLQAASDEPGKPRPVDAPETQETAGSP